MKQDDPAVAIRRLIRAADKASLSTLYRKGNGARDGWPYGSLVLSACDAQAAPLLLLSDLADHARNIKSDDRISLLFDGTAGRRDPLTGPRATLLGTLRAIGDKNMLALYLARHKSAELYAGFGDFHLYRMHVEAAHLVAGFGNVRWLNRRALRLAGVDAKIWAAAQSALVARINGQRSAPIAGTVVGVDPEGLDIRAGARLRRLAFDRVVATPRGVAAALKRLR